MKIKLVFEDWRQVGKSESIYNTQLGMDLSCGDLHSGTTFDADITIPEDAEQEILQAYEDDKAYPVFRIIPQTTVN